MTRFFLLCCILMIGSPGSAELCSKEKEAVPCTPDPGPETTRLKSEVYEYISAAQRLEARVEAARIRYSALRNETTDKEAELSACAKYRELKKNRDDLYKKAITVTSDLYNVHPNSTDEINVAKSTDPKLAWMSGLSAIWDPKVVDSGPGIHLAFKIFGTDLENHYGGLANMDTENAKVRSNYAATLPDGQTIILKGLIDRALKNRDLGLLASVIYHETQHFNYLQRDCASPSGSCGWATKTQDEHDAYEAQNALADIFGFKYKSDRDDFLAQERALAADIKAGRLESFNPSPDEERNWKHYYESVQINLDEEYVI